MFQDQRGSVMSHRRRVQWFVVLATVVGMAASASAVSAARRASSPIDGRWESSFPLAKLLVPGASRACAEKAYGPWTAEFSDGHYRIHNARSGAGGTGTFTIVSHTFRSRTITAVCDKSPSVCAVSVFRDRLAFTNEPGYPQCAWGVASWQRVSRQPDDAAPG